MLMAINASDIIDALKNSLDGFCVRDISLKRDLGSQFEGLPVEVQWDYGHGQGETRRVIAVSVENSGEPEKPTLRLIVGPNYSDDPDDMAQFPGGKGWQDNSGVDEMVDPEPFTEVGYDEIDGQCNYATEDQVTGYETDGPSSYDSPSSTAAVMRDYDPEFERLLAEEEEIERRAREEKS